MASWEASAAKTVIRNDSVLNEGAHKERTRTYLRMHASTHVIVVIGENRKPPMGNQFPDSSLSAEQPGCKHDPFSLSELRRKKNNHRTEGSPGMDTDRSGQHLGNDSIADAL